MSLFKKKYISLLLCYLSDIIRFAQSSALKGVYLNRETMSGHILRISHALEKGMALPKPKKDYGMTKANELIAFLGEYHDRFGEDQILHIGLESIRALIEYHQSVGAENKLLSDSFQKLLDKTNIKEIKSKNYKAGRRRIHKRDLLSKLPRSPEDFFLSRASVRQFSEEVVDRDLLDRAIIMALKTPSVCNRQTCKVRVYQGNDKIQSVLSYQDGNVGFGDSASAILVVTSDMSGFYKPGERNQGYIDGGLFSMSIVYALHSLGLGTCMLNWSQGYRTDNKFRKAANIPDKELVIMMIAVGNLKDEFWVAESPRLQLGSVANYECSI